MRRATQFFSRLGLSVSVLAVDYVHRRTIFIIVLESSNFLLQIALLVVNARSWVNYPALRALFLLRENIHFHPRRTKSLVTAKIRRRCKHLHERCWLSRPYVKTSVGRKTGRNIHCIGFMELRLVRIYISLCSIQPGNDGCRGIFPFPCLQSVS